MFLYVISNMQIQHVIACMFILLLPYFKEKYYWVRSGGSTALMISPKCLLTCGFIFFSLAIFAQVLIPNRSFFLLLFFTCFSFHLKHQCTCCLGHLECWEICFSSAVFFKPLVWMLAPEKASQVLTHRRESLLPLCLCFWEVPRLQSVRSQLPFVNCLNFFFIFYHLGSLHMSARRGMRAEPLNLH